MVACHLAGSVAARKNRRQATSDWMEMERQRGISITSTVLRFDYHGYALNLLDTPGHEDFREDTYRLKPVSEFLGSLHFDKTAQQEWRVPKENSSWGGSANAKSTVTTTDRPFSGEWLSCH